MWRQHSVGDHLSSGPRFRSKCSWCSASKSFYNIHLCYVMEENLNLYVFLMFLKWEQESNYSWLILNSAWFSEVETVLLVLLRIVWRDARCTATIRPRIFLTPVQRSQLFVRSWTAVWAVVWTTTLTWSPAWPADSRRIWTLYSSKGQFGQAKSVFETAWTQ